MKKIAVIVMLSMGLTLHGCGNAVNVSEPDPSEMQEENMSALESSEMQKENPPETKTFETQEENTEVSQGGPYGRISILLPDGWSCEACPIDSEQLMYGMYGLHFYPEGVEKGYVELAYIEWFGVCGTGLEEETATLAGSTVGIGTYDNHEYWDFVTFQEENEGIVALTYFVEDWWSAYGNQVLDILATMSFDRNVREGSAYIYNAESEVSEIGLSASLKNITPTSATFVFHQYDADAPTGELTYGDAFVIETLKNDKWEQAPIVIEGDYAFNAVAHMIAAGDTIEQEINWEWLYGALEPSEYRIKTDINDFRGSGDYDKHTICTYFILN